MDQTPKQPFLEVFKGADQYGTVELTQACMTIGRSSSNDIVLPDPQRYVSRDEHCVLERHGSNWYVISHEKKEESELSTPKNATFLDQGEGLREVRGRMRLADGNRIYIQVGGSGTLQTNDPQFWIILLFRDPEGTQPTYPAPYLEYDETCGILFRITGSERTQIPLTPSEEKLIRYMFKWNQRHGDTLTPIPSANLKQAIWGELAGEYNAAALQKVIDRLRGKLEINPKAPPQFLITKPTRGYLLRTHLLPSIKQDIPKKE